MIIQRKMRQWKRPIVGVAVFILDRDSKRYILTQKPKAGMVGKWSLPGGNVHYGESTHDAVAREVKEETGLGIWGVGLVMNPSISYVYENGDHYIIFFYEAYANAGDVKKKVWREQGRKYPIKWFKSGKFPKDLMHPLGEAVGLAEMVCQLL